VSRAEAVTSWKRPYLKSDLRRQMDERAEATASDRLESSQAQWEEAFERVMGEQDVRQAREQWCARVRDGRARPKGKLTDTGRLRVQSLLSVLG